MRGKGAAGLLANATPHRHVDLRDGGGGADRVSRCAAIASIEYHARTLTQGELSHDMSGFDDCNVIADVEEGAAHAKALAAEREVLIHAKMPELEEPCDPLDELCKANYENESDDAWLAQISGIIADSSSEE